jgi:hypothetical protein
MLKETLLYSSRKPSEWISTTVFQAVEESRMAPRGVAHLEDFEIIIVKGHSFDQFTLVVIVICALRNIS